MKNIFLFAFTAIFMLFSCGDSRDNPGDWLIPSDRVFDGGPGKDGIPSVDSPQFTDASQATFLNDNDLVVGIIVDGEARAYPHIILDWHEIVNDDIGSESVAITYCPLTGTAIAWDRIVDGKKTTFGVSGKLYNTNLIPYDRETDSYWSQIGLNCVNGELISTTADLHPIIETTWATWRSMYPNSQVLNTNTGFSRNYGNYPYGDYITNNDRLIFPVEPRDTRLATKERVLGVLGNGANRAYSIEEFATPQLIVDNLGGEELIVVGSKADNFIVAFRNQGLEGLTLNMSNFPIIATDAQGNQLEASGLISAGPMAGTQLKQPTAFMGFWFSFGAFYPGIEIYNQ